MIRKSNNTPQTTASTIFNKEALSDDSEAAVVVFNNAVVGIVVVTGQTTLQLSREVVASSQDAPSSGMGIGIGGLPSLKILIFVMSSCSISLDVDE